MLGTGDGIEDEDELVFLFARQADTLSTCAALVTTRAPGTTTAEPRRLPPQDAERGVIRTYVRSIGRPTLTCWLLSQFALELPPPSDSEAEALTRSDRHADSKSKFDADPQHGFVDGAPRRRPSG